MGSDIDNFVINKCQNCNICLNGNNLCSLLLTQVQLSICVQYCYNPWGAMQTAPLSIPSLIKLLWLQTRVLPTTKITDLRVAASYKRLKRTLREGFGRASVKPFWKQVLEQLGDGSGMTDETVDEVAMALGFEPQWLEKEVPSKKRGQAARRARQMEDDELRGSLEPFVRRPQPVSYTHLTLPTNTVTCRSRWSPDH